MIKKIAWETFKNTGNINTFIELKQIEDIEKRLEGQLLENGLEKISIKENQNIKEQG